MKNILRNSFKKITLPIVLFFGICGFSSNLFSQSYYNMAAGNYSESFTGWTNWAVNWNGLAVNTTGTIPSATRITAVSTNMLTNMPTSSGGVQTANTATNIQFLSTGSSGNTSSTGGDLNLNFSGRNVGNISFDLAQVNNSTGDRIGTLLVYTSPDGTTWTTLAGTGLPYTVTNNVAGSASISLLLPASLNNAATAKIRFYYYNGPSNGTVGSRPKVSLDNLLVTSTSAGLILPVINSFSPTSGLPGDSITITGTDFTGATAVKFNNVAASVFSVDSATQISATVPTGASTGTISVTTPNGTGTSLGTFTIPALTLSAPSSINEGVSGSTGTISIPTALGAPLVVTIGSSTVADLAVSADGVTYSASASVTIPAGSTTSPVFHLQAPLDDVVDADSSVTLTASATGYVSKTAVVVVKNIDLASADLTGSGYTETFSAMGAVNGPLPLGWSDSGPVTAFSSQTWGSASASAGVLTASGILGYQHTGSTGTNNLVLTLRNSTGSAITALTINFKGRAARLTEAGVTRSPVFSVVVAGQTNPGLAYSTSYGDNYQMSGGTTGLNIATGQKFTISWASDRGAGGGSSQQIGLSDVQVSTGFTPTAPSLGGVTVDPAYIADTSASLLGNVTSDGGETVTESGFVYCLTSQSSTPTIGGTGVVQKVFATPGIGTLYDEASPLLPSTSFTVRAYAINSIGTNYSAPTSFTTMAPNPEFTSGYTQNFNGFQSMTTIPDGWKCYSTGGANSYIGSWTSGSSSAGFYGETNRPGVLGFTHTTTSSNNINTLTLVNRSGGTLTNLYVSYMGEVTQTNNERCPAWVVNSTDANGATEVTALAYSTLGGTNATKTAQITGLSISNGATYSLSWTSDRGLGTNSSRRIGIGFVQIATTAAAIVSNAPVVSSPATLSATVGVPVSYQIAASESPTGFWAQNIPSGLTLNASNGLISGTLLSTNANASTMVVTAYNAAGVGNQNVALTVVASVKTTPTLTVAPSASAITVGQALSASILTGGSASVAGAFAWTTPSEVPALGTASYGVTFTPTDTVNYNTFTTTVSVAVNKITSTISVAPSASAITEGQALSASVLSGGTGSVAGAFAWTTPSTVPGVGTPSYGVTFTPTDTANYSTAVTTVSLTVNSAGTTYSGWLGAASPSDAAFLDYVFGAATPGTLDPSLKPTVAVTGGKLVLTYYVRQVTVGLTVTPKASANLALGSAGWSTAGVDDTADVSPITVNGVSVQRHAASVPVSGLSKFLRIEAVQQ